MKTIIHLFVIVILLAGCNAKEQKEPEETKEDQIAVAIKDLTAPVISLKAESIDLKLNDKFEANDYLEGVYDNLDGNIKCDIIGSPDMAKSGLYEVKYTARDSSGNVSSKLLAVNVAEPIAETPLKPSNKSDSNSTKQKESLDPKVIQEYPDKPVKTALTPKRFLFNEGYTMPGGDNPATNACMLYMSGYNGGCFPLTDSAGIYIGMEYRP